MRLSAVRCAVIERVAASAAASALKCGRYGDARYWAGIAERAQAAQGDDMARSVAARDGLLGALAQRRLYGHASAVAA